MVTAVGPWGTRTQPASALRMRPTIAHPKSPRTLVWYALTGEVGDVATFNPSCALFLILASPCDVFEPPFPHNADRPIHATDRRAGGSEPYLHARHRTCSHGRWVSE